MSRIHTPMTVHRPTRIELRTRTVGSHYGTACEVYRREPSGRRRLLHTTDPRPYGFTAAALDDGMAWATDRGYIYINDACSGY